MLKMCKILSQNKVKTYILLTGGEEMNLYYELLQFPVFSMREVNTLYSSERTARTALGKLVKEGMVLKIRNSLYTCVSGENGGPVANRFQIASAIHPSAYVSHHSAFEYYGISDQVFYDVYVSSEMRFHDFVFDGYTYHFVKSQMQQGVTSPQFGGGVKVTDKERTILDSIKDTNLIAWLEETITCISSVAHVDEAKLLDYLEIYGNPFLYQKMGFIASQYRNELNISDEFINICKQRKGSSKRYLVNDISEPAYARDWSLVYPKHIKEMKNGVILLFED
jgi:predicted transcriptional regulator of viral defense system